MLEQTTTQTPQANQAGARNPAIQADPQQPTLTNTADQAVQSVGALYTALDGALQRQVNDNPYLTLAAAAGVGFVIGGGMRTSFGQLLMRLSVRAFGPPLMNATLHGVLERATGGR
jgi:ElaB/YqjD/DUF883 family membrane-anchored ribosome-binding protein